MLPAYQILSSLILLSINPFPPVIEILVQKYDDWPHEHRDVVDGKQGTTSTILLMIIRIIIMLIHDRIGEAVITSHATTTTTTE